MNKKLYSFVIIIVIFLISQCNGETITISQGSIAYMNETVDISLAVAYPDFQVAWCEARNYDCDPPDQVIDITGNMHTYWLNPEKFRYGTYYRWDGEWHRAENSIAFTILPGQRPIKRINQTVNKTNVTQQIRPHEGPYEYLIARGDTPTVYTVLNRSDVCQLWIFSDTMTTYDMALSYSNDTYSRKLTESETFSMSSGEYDGYIQCNGNNGLQDIFLLDGELDTPYDDRIVPDVPVVAWNLLNVKRQFDQLAKDIPRFDDLLIPIRVSISEPTVTITSTEQDDTKLYISGTTTLGNDTPIVLKLDPDNYVLPKDVALNTWTTYASGSIDAPRTFNTAISLNKDDLYIGMHEITSTVENNGDVTVSSLNFRVSDVYVMPTPTPEPKRMIYGKDWEGIPVKVTPTPTPEVTETQEVVITVIPTVNVTVNATPNVTTVKTTAVPTANQTIPTIPVNVAIAIAAVCSAMVLRREL
jgi:hypothetical protein